MHIYNGVTNQIKLSELYFSRYISDFMSSARSVTDPTLGDLSGCSGSGSENTEELFIGSPRERRST